MNEKGIQQFLSRVHVGDEVSISTTIFNDSFHGKVRELDENKVILENTMYNGELFEDLAREHVVDIPLRTVWAWTEIGEE